MSTMGAMKAASTMTRESISSCAATKLLVTTPNTVRKTSQNARTLNMLNRGDLSRSSSVSPAVAVAAEAGKLGGVLFLFHIHGVVHGDDAHHFVVFVGDGQGQQIVAANHFRGALRGQDARAHTG